MPSWDFTRRRNDRNEPARRVEATGGNMFTGAERTTINGGEFNAVRTESVTINNSYNLHVPSNASQDYLTRIAGHSVISGAAGSAIRSGIQPPNNAVRSEQPSPLTGAPFEILEWHEEGGAPPFFRERAASIFYESLILFGLGLPIWNPIPNHELPISYRRKGISVGDVGLITERGAFEYLFNITLPIDHPDNPRDLPRDLFSPSLAVQIENKPSSTPTSFPSQGMSVTYNEDGSISFKSSSSPESHGGVVALPLGYKSYQILNKRPFRRQFSENAFNWCAYVIDKFGSDARNGDLCIVTGCDRTQACGLAAFKVPASGTVQLCFGAAREVQGIQMYGWREVDCPGFQDHKSLPGAQDILELREDEAFERGCMDNLGIFVRTLKIRVREDIWAELESAPDSPKCHVPEGGVGLSNTPHRSSHAGDHRGASESTNQGPGSPSDTINKYLLNAEPAAKIAMTSDDEWVSVLKGDDSEFPDSEELIKRIRNNYTIELEDGVVSLEPKTPNSESVAQKLHNTVALERKIAGEDGPKIHHHASNISRRVDTPTISTLMGGHRGELVDSPDSDTGTADSLECETLNSSGSFQSLGGRTKVNSGSFSADIKKLRTETGDAIPERPFLKQRRDGSGLIRYEMHE